MSELPELTKTLKPHEDFELDKFQRIQMLENGFASAKIKKNSKPANSFF